MDYYGLLAVLTRQVCVTLADVAQLIFKYQLNAEL